MSTLVTIEHDIWTDVQRIVDELNIDWRSGDAVQAVRSRTFHSCHGRSRHDPGLERTIFGPDPTCGVKEIVAQLPASGVDRVSGAANAPSALMATSCATPTTARFR